MTMTVEADTCQAGDQRLLLLCSSHGHSSQLNLELKPVFWIYLHSLSNFISCPPLTFYLPPTLPLYSVMLQHWPPYCLAATLPPSHPRVFALAETPFLGCPRALQKCFSVSVLSVEAQASSPPWSLDSNVTSSMSAPQHSIYNCSFSMWPMYLCLLG